MLRTTSLGCEYREWLAEVGCGEWSPAVRLRNWEARGLDESPTLTSLGMVAGFMVTNIFSESEPKTGRLVELGRALVLWWHWARCLALLFPLNTGQCPGLRLPLALLSLVYPFLPTHLHLWCLLFAFRVTFPHCQCLGHGMWLGASAMSYPVWFSWELTPFLDLV